MPKSSPSLSEIFLAWSLHTIIQSTTTLVISSSRNNSPLLLELFNLIKQKDGGIVETVYIWQDWLSKFGYRFQVPCIRSGPRREIDPNSTKIILLDTRRPITKEAQIGRSGKYYFLCLDRGKIIESSRSEQFCFPEALTETESRDRAIFNLRRRMTAEKQKKESQHIKILQNQGLPHRSARKLARMTTTLERSFPLLPNEEKGPNEPNEPNEPIEQIEPTGGIESKDDISDKICIAVTSKGKRCKNPRKNGTCYCGIQSHKKLGKK